MRAHPLIANTDQALAFLPVIGHPGLCAQRPGPMPVALGAHARPDRRALRCPQGQPVANAMAHTVPLLPVAHTDTPPQPVVQRGDWPVVIRDAAVAHPTAAICGELLEPIVHGQAPASPGELTQPVTQVLVGALGPGQLFAPSER